MRSELMCQAHHHLAGFREVTLVEDVVYRERQTVPSKVVLISLLC